MNERAPGEQPATLFLRLAARELEAPAARLRERFLVLAEESDPWRAREEIEALSHDIHRLSSLVETLADAADIEAGRVRLEDAGVNLARVFSERIAKRLWRFPSFRFLPEMPARLDVRGDRLRLAFLIDDLLDAAVHVAPEGGIIHALLREEADHVVVSTTNRDAELPPARFASFIDWMVEDLENPGTLGGIGIALYRSHRTALMLGGHLELAATAGGGVSFTASLPLARDASSVS